MTIILISDVWAEFKGLWKTIYYRIMPPLPILTQGGLSLPIIPIPPNSPPPNHSVLTPNSNLTSNDCTFTALENNPRIKRPKSSSIPHMLGNDFTIVDSISLSQFDYQSGLYPETDSIKTDSAFTALENNPRIKRPKSSSIPHKHRNNFTIVDSIVHIPLPI